MRTAFARSGVVVSTAKLNAFFEEVDTNKDGVISYEEWRFARLSPSHAGVEPPRLTDSRFRDFLLFLPAESSSDLRAILSYYTATGNLNPEGDVHINDLQGLGTGHSFPKLSDLAVWDAVGELFQVHALAELIPSAYAEVTGPSELASTFEVGLVSVDGDLDLEWLSLPPLVAIWMSLRYYEQKLTENTPQLGYFIAGGIAGVISRTATAPFDRLKVYLIAQTESKKPAIDVVKEGAPLKAAGQASRQLVDAVKELWRAGGIRSLFAG